MGFKTHGDCVLDGSRESKCRLGFFFHGKILEFVGFPYPLLNVFRFHSCRRAGMRSHARAHIETEETQLWLINRAMNWFHFRAHSSQFLRYLRSANNFHILFRCKFHTISLVEPIVTSASSEA